MPNPNTVIRTSCRWTAAALLLFGATAAVLAQERLDPVALQKTPS